MGADWLLTTVLSLQRGLVWAAPHFEKKIICQSLKYNCEILHINLDSCLLGGSGLLEPVLQGNIGWSQAAFALIWGKNSSSSSSQGLGLRNNHHFPILQPVMLLNKFYYVT